MTRSEAEKHRTELVSERDIAGEENDGTYFGRVYPRIQFQMAVDS